jgi:uncharacterized SAM-binding protein YcdF (DUF218 family)
VLRQGVVLSAVVTVVLVPPVNLAVLALAGALLTRRWPRAGGWLCVLSALALVLLAMPIVPNLLMAGLESGLRPVGPDLATGSPPPQAIVILGAEAADDDSRPDRTTVGPLTLQRLRGGAELARASGLPVLVTGGVVSAYGPPVATLMAHSLTEDFGVTPRWIEAASGDTWQNATFTAAILRPRGIRSVVLVTHAWHMRRALIAFHAAGLTVLPAPLLLGHAPRLSFGEVIPRVSAWQRGYFALHEWLGGLWYGWRAWIAPAPG